MSSMYKTWCTVGTKFEGLQISFFVLTSTNWSLSLFSNQNVFILLAISIYSMLKVLNPRKAIS